MFCCSHIHNTCILCVSIYILCVYLRSTPHLCAHHVYTNVMYILSEHEDGSGEGSPYNRSLSKGHRRGENNHTTLHYILLYRYLLCVL